MSLPPEALAYQTAHINDNRGPQVIAVDAVLTILATVAIGLRFVVRWRTHVGFKADDYTILLAGVMAWLSFVVYVYQTRNGLGKHVITLTDAQFSGFFKGLLFLGPGFIVAVMLNQLSFLFLYNRVFTTMGRRFRIILYILGVAVVVLCISCFFGAFFFCRPFIYTWNKNIPGHCYSVENVYVVHDVLNVVTDIGIVAFPVPIILGLQMNRGTKFAVIGMFLLGGFVCVINLIRLPSLINVDQIDPTFNDVNSTIWTHAELCLGIVGACLPCFRPLFKRLRNAFSTNPKSSSTPQPRSKVPTDKYKTLEEKEPSVNGSKIALVQYNQWGAAGSTMPSNNKAVVQSGGNERDIELGKYPGVINVTRDIDVSSARSKNED